MNKNEFKKTLEEGLKAGDLVRLDYKFNGNWYNDGSQIYVEEDEDGPLVEDSLFGIYNGPESLEKLEYMDDQIFIGANEDSIYWQITTPNVVKIKVLMKKEKLFQD